MVILERFKSRVYLLLENLFAKSPSDSTSHRFPPEEVPGVNAMNNDRSPPGSVEVKVTPTVKFVLELVGLGLIPTKIACQYAEDPDSIFVHTIPLAKKATLKLKAVHFHVIS